MPYNPTRACGVYQHLTEKARLQQEILKFDPPPQPVLFHVTQNLKSDIIPQILDQVLYNNQKSFQMSVENKSKKRSNK